MTGLVDKMSGVVERLRQTVSGFNRETLLQVAAQWRGRGVELLARLSAQMSQSPLKALGVIVVVNGLFYTLISRHLVNRLDHCTKGSDRAQPKIWVGVVALGSLTALINIGFSKLVQIPLSRITLLAITSSVIFLRLLFNSQISALPPRRNEGGTSLLPRPKPQDSTHRSSAPPESSASKSVSNLKNFGFTEEDLDLFVENIDHSEALSQFDTFIKSIPEHAKTLFSTSLEKKHLIFVIISEFQRMRKGYSTSPLRLKQVLKRISDEIFNRQSVSLAESEPVRKLIDRGFMRLQLANLVAAIGQEHRISVLNRLHQFVDNLDEICAERASQMDTDTLNVLLLRIINRFNKLKTKSQPAHFDSLQTLDRLFAMYERRFQNDKYHVLIERTSQDDIDSVMNFFSRYAQNPVSVQDEILDHVEQSLLPLFKEDLSENRQILEQIVDDFLDAKSEQKLTDMKTALRLFDEVCVKHRPLEANDDYQDLVESGFDGAQLATLVASIGNEHRTKVMDKFARFVQWCLVPGREIASRLIQERGNHILRSIINDLNALKTGSQSSHFNSLKTFDKIICAYRIRFENEKYRALIFRVPQNYIDSLASILCQYAENFQHFQDSILDSFTQDLLPLLTKSAEENNQLVNKILNDFNFSRGNKQFAHIYEAIRFFSQVCDKNCPLELDRNYQTLIGFGFDREQLTNVIASVGHDHPKQVMDRFNRFVEECQESEHQAAGAVIQNEDQRNALLQSMINSFNMLKESSRTTDFNSLETFDRVCRMYESRLKNEKYHAFVASCPQEQISYVVDTFNEYLPREYFYMDHYQRDNIDTLEKHLLPLLMKTPQENGALVEQIQSEFDGLRKTQQLDNVYGAHKLFAEACLLHRHYQKLIDWGFSNSQLTALVTLIGNDHRQQVMDRLNRFVEECQESEHQAAGAVIQNEEQRNALLQSMINSFNMLKESSRTPDFNSFETFDRVCRMYESRLKNEKYHVLVARCPQEQINSVVDTFNEYLPSEYFYMDHYQRDNINLLEKHLLPLLMQTPQENGALVAQIQSEFDRLRKTQQIDTIYRAQSLFKEICVRHCPLEANKHYRSLVELGFEGSQLASLVASIGHDHRHQVMNRFSQFVQKCCEHTEAAAMIQNEEQKNALLQAMINCFNQLKDCAQTPDFNSCETFERVCGMYKCRLENETYRELVFLCSQAQINLLADLFNEYDIRYYYLDISQNEIFNSFKTHLLPHLTKTSQENREIVEQIQLEFDRLRLAENLDGVYAVRRLFEQACKSYHAGVESVADA